MTMMAFIFIFIISVRGYKYFGCQHQISCYVASNVEICTRLIVLLKTTLTDNNKMIPPHKKNSKQIQNLCLCTMLIH